MIKLHKDYRILDDPVVNRIYENNYDKVIAFMRGDLLFVFNFHSTISFTDYGLPLKGKFRIILDSDNPEFGGFNRVDRTRIYLSAKKAERPALDVPYYLYLYLPSRTRITSYNVCYTKLCSYNFV